MAGEYGKKPKYTAIVLAAGSGSRMHSEVKKQYMELCGKPVVVHSLERFEQSEWIDSVILVVGHEDLQYALNLSLQYGLRKVKNIVEGGAQRYQSVYNGVKVADPDTDYLLIHDGARPLVSEDLIARCCSEVAEYKACVAAVPVKDTIKTSDTDGYAVQTPDRSRLWAVQTPQAFSYPLFVEAYRKLFETIRAYQSDASKITDDAMIVEGMADRRVKLIEGDYRNLKITTPEDMAIAEALLREEGKESSSD